MQINECINIYINTYICRALHSMYSCLMMLCKSRSYKPGKPAYNPVHSSTELQVHATAAELTSGPKRVARAWLILSPGTADMSRRNKCHPAISTYTSLPAASGSQQQGACQQHNWVLWGGGYLAQMRIPRRPFRSRLKPTYNNAANTTDCRHMLDIYRPGVITPCEETLRDFWGNNPPSLE